ncbi:MAG: hypothetical protein U1E77_05360 [Inhella sp.]
MIKLRSFAVGLLSLLLVSGMTVAQGAEPPPPWERGVPEQPGRSELKSAVVSRNSDGDWELRVQALHTGPGLHTMLYVFAPLGGEPDSGETNVGSMGISLGLREYLVPLRRPYKMTKSEAFSTDRLVIRVMPKWLAGEVAASMELKHTIHWADRETDGIQTSMQGRTVDQLVDDAVKQMDDRWDLARRTAAAMLDRARKRDPSHVRAMVESARFALFIEKPEGGPGPEQVKRAEQLLVAALQREPNQAEALILLGLMRGVQGRQDEAEQLFQRAEANEPANIHLWLYWGQLNLAQGREDEAIRRFKQAINRPRSIPSHERAREQAFDALLQLLAKRPDVGELEDIHRQHMQYAGPHSCAAVRYAGFLVRRRAAFDQAIELAGQGCDDQGGRLVKGLAYYGQWAAAKDRLVKDGLLSLAQVHLPYSPRMWREMVASEAQFKVSQRLRAETRADVDVPDDKGLTALSIALQEGDTVAAQRLMRLGGRPEKLVGAEQMPAALVPLLRRDVATVRWLAKQGVKVASLRYQGLTGLEIARQDGDPELVQAVTGKDRKP